MQPRAKMINPGICIRAEYFAPINTNKAPTQNIPKPSLKVCQLLVGLLAKMFNQLMFVSSVSCV
jgi:hypothetical protein